MPVNSYLNICLVALLYSFPLFLSNLLSIQTHTPKWLWSLPQPLCLCELVNLLLCQVLYFPQSLSVSFMCRADADNLPSRMLPSFFSHYCIICLFIDLHIFINHFLYYSFSLFISGTKPNFVYFHNFGQYLQSSWCLLKNIYFIKNVNVDIKEMYSRNCI